MANTLKSLDQFVGQTNLKKQLTLAIHSSLMRGVRLEHVLLVGNPGMGKTRLASIIADEMFQDYEEFVMPIDEKILRALMQEFEGVVLLDELHRAPPRQQEMFLTVLYNGYMQDRGGYRIENNNITFIGATTEGDKVNDAVRDRFPIRPLFDPYSDEEMAAILIQMAEREGIVIPRKAAWRLGKACLGVPRMAERIVYSWRDIGLVRKQVDAQQVLNTLRLTDTGLTAEHVRYCELLGKAGGKAGVDLLRQLLAMPSRAIERLETDLIKQGFLVRESSGRQLTARGYELAGIQRFHSTRRNQNGR